MLHRIDCETFEGVEFIPREALGVGKTGGQFVFPTLFVPNSAARVDEGFELGGQATHVGWRSEDDRISSIEICDRFVVFPAAIAEIRIFDSQ